MCVTCFVVEFRNKKQTETESGGVNTNKMQGNERDT